MFASSRKAVVAAVVAAAGALTAALSDEKVTQNEAIGIVAAAVAAGYAVWRVSNAPA